jgi:hypothetical protein
MFVAGAWSARRRLQGPFVSIVSSSEEAMIVLDSPYDFNGNWFSGESGDTAAILSAWEQRFSL